MTTQFDRLAALSRHALKRLDPPVYDPEAERMLVDALEECAPFVVKEFDFPPCGDVDDLATFEGEAPDPERHAMLKVDAALICATAKVDRVAAEAARERRNAARNTDRRWALWADEEMPQGLVLFAEVVWQARLAARWRAARERAGSTRPAVMAAVHREVLAPLMAGRVEAHGELAMCAGRTLGLIDRDAPKHVAIGLARVGAVLGHKLVNYLVHRAWTAKEAGEREYGRVIVRGGWQGLAGELGSSNRDPELLKALVAVGSRIQWASSAIVKGSLWGFNEYRGGPGKPGELVFVLTDLLLPGRARALANTTANPQAQLQTQRDARRLVPELRFPPPIGALRERDRGAAWTLARLFVLEVVDRSHELVKAGGVKITRARWEELANEAGLPRASVARLLRAWKAGDEDAPALLLEVSPDRYHLGPAHDLERAFIEAQGSVRAKGTARGRVGASKRWRGSDG